MAEPLKPTAEGVETTPKTAATQVVLVEDLPPRKRRRWIPWLIGTVVLLGLLVVGFFVADELVRQYATGYVKERIAEVLKLDPGTPVDVDLGEGSVLLQAASGALNEVNVAVPSVQFGDLTGSAQIRATGVPIDSAQPVETLRITVTVTETNVRKLAGFLSGIELKSIELEDGLIVVGTELNVVFFTVPVTVALAPSASDGGISFEPTTLTLNNQTVSVDDLRTNPLVGALAGQLLASRTVCVASYLPKALIISDVDVVATNLVVQISGDGVALSDPGLATFGTCPGE